MLRACVKPTADIAGVLGLGLACASPYDGVERGAPPPDAGTPTPPGSADGGPSSGGDGGAATDGGAKGDRCASATFCDQFERALPLAGWPESWTNGVALAIEETGALSPTHALKVSVNQATVPGTVTGA